MKPVSYFHKQMMTQEKDLMTEAYFCLTRSNSNPKKRYPLMLGKYLHDLLKLGKR
jgi:hypothetical protein